MRQFLGLCLAVMCVGCDSAIPSFVVDGGVRQATIAEATATSQPCDGGHTVLCDNNISCCGTSESCVPAAVSRPAQSDLRFCGVCPAEFPAACSRTTCCRAAGECIVNYANQLETAEEAGFGKCRCPVGEKICGEGCCIKGTTCVEGVCRGCPPSAPNLCGTNCQESPCDSGGTSGGGGGACSPPTGCGNGWLSSCDNRCYATSSECNAAGPSQGCSTTSCRRCP